MFVTLDCAGGTWDRKHGALWRQRHGVRLNSDVDRGEPVEDDGRKIPAPPRWKLRFGDWHG